MFIDFIQRLEKEYPAPMAYWEFDVFKVWLYRFGEKGLETIAVMKDDPVLEGKWEPVEALSESFRLEHLVPLGELKVLLHNRAHERYGRLKDKIDGL